MLRPVPVKSQPALKDGTLLKWLAGMAILGALLYFGYHR